LHEVHVEDARLMSTDDAGELAHGTPTRPTERREVGKGDAWELQKAPDSALRFLLETHDAAPAVLAKLEGQLARERLDTANANWPQIVEG
jgi:hypothetical protein